jgi:hypothetical protein
MHEGLPGRRTDAGPVRPAAPTPGTGRPGQAAGTGTSTRHAAPGTGRPAQALGTGTSTAHAAPGTRTPSIPLPLVPRGRGSTACLRVQGPRVDRVGCPVSYGPSLAVSTCPGAACPACRVSGVLRSIAVRVHVSRSRRRHGRTGPASVLRLRAMRGTHAEGICWADQWQNRGLTMQEATRANVAYGHFGGAAAAQGGRGCFWGVGIRS